MRGLICTLCISLSIPAPAADDNAKVDEKNLPKEVVTKIGVEMVLIPSGVFVMGDDDGKDDEKPQHKVSIRAFYMDKREVPQSHFEKMVGFNPSKFVGKDNPVDRARWYDAAEYCNVRSLREGLQPCYDDETWKCSFEANGYRLPTEAEWEYACRAGSTADYHFGSSKRKLTTYAWFSGNSRERTHPVGRKKPNAWGLCDISGNLWEWCNDFYQADYYGHSPQRDPRGPGKSETRVLRGGSWASDAKECRSSSRRHDEPAIADICEGVDTYGFRCVRKAVRLGPNRSGLSSGHGTSIAHRAPFPGTATCFPRFPVDLSPPRSYDIFTCSAEITPAGGRRAKQGGMEAPLMILYRCPHCGKSFQGEDSEAGEEKSCALCGGAYRIPTPSPTPGIQVELTAAPVAPDESAGGPAGGEALRASPRFDLAEAACTLRKEGAMSVDKTEHPVADVSRTGLKLVYGARRKPGTLAVAPVAPKFAVGDRLEVSLRMGAFSKPLKLVCEVMRIEQLGFNKGYEVGLRIVEAPEDEKRRLAMVEQYEDLRQRKRSKEFGG